MRTIFFTALLLAYMSGTCMGGQTVETNDSQDSSPTISAKLTGGMISDAKFKESEGSAQITTGQLRIRAEGFSLGYQGRKYSWSDTNRLDFNNGSAKPWDALHRIRLGYEHEDQINEDWFYSVEIAGTSSFEKEMDGSFGAALRGGFMYVINDNWATAFGALIFTNNIQTSLLPYLGISYEDFAKDGSGVFMSLGAPSTEAGYAFSHESKVRFSFDMEGSTYRLKDDSSVVKKGYVETSSMITGIYFDWKPTDAFSMSLGPEYHFGREMKFYNKNGDRHGSTIKQESAVGARLQLGYSF